MIDMTDIPENLHEKMKDQTLLILTPAYPNKDTSFIAEMFVWNQVTELKNFFKKIIVIAPVFQSFGYFKKDKFCKDYSYDNVEVFFPRCLYIPILWLSKIVIDNRLKVVEQTIERNHLEFDLIHAHFTWPSGYIGVKLKEKYGKPVVTTVHEHGDRFDLEVSMNHPLLINAWSDADALIRVNRKDVPVLKRYNENVYSIPNGYSPNFHPIDTNLAREQLNLPQDKKILFALGNLIPRKGFNYLIDAMEQICKQREDTFCYIGGAGPEKENLQRQVEHLHLCDKVTILGSVPNDLVSLWMNAADLFVLPSIDESFGVVQIEALACGKPVVAARNRGSEEVIVNEQFGMLAEPADAGDLALKILYSLEQKWSGGRILVYAKRFTWEKIADEVMEVYSRGLNQVSM